MKILAFDTSSARTAVAVVDADRVLAEDDGPSEALHGETLMPRIRAVLTRAGVALDAIELVAVGVGPGSFTGLRVGLAAAKGFAIATGVALRGVDSLAILARAALGSGADAQDVVAVPVVDAHRGELFVAAYAASADGSLQALCAPACDRPARAVARVHDALDGLAPDAQIVLCGDAVRAYGAAFAAAFGERVRFAGADAELPRGRYVAEEARASWASSGPSDAATLEPVYLREAEVTLPKP